MSLQALKNSSFVTSLHNFGVTLVNRGPGKALYEKNPNATVGAALGALALLTTAFLATVAFCIFKATKSKPDADSTTTKADSQKEKTGQTSADKTAKTDKA